MFNIFLISDPHFSHVGVTQFLNADGSKLRPWDNVEEMNEALVANWNDVVRPQDKVYVLGDVAFKSKHLDILDRLNGDKVLIKGNHDLEKLSTYARYFRDVRGCHVLDKNILTHIPIHPDSMNRWRTNIHGHLHGNRIRNEGLIDPRYHSVCVEQTDFTPISYEDLKMKIAEEKELYGPL